jgi:hypothetical protein
MLRNQQPHVVLRQQGYVVDCYAAACAVGVPLMVVAVVAVVLYRLLGFMLAA